MNSVVGIWVGGLIGVGGVSLGLVSPDRPPAPTASVLTGAAPAPLLTSIDDQGHVYALSARCAPAEGVPGANWTAGGRGWRCSVSPAASPQVDGIVCEYLGPRLTAQRPGRDGVRETCPATPPTQDLIWTDGGTPLPVDPADPGIPACRAVGGTPTPPQLGGGGGEGAPVDFCMIAGHLWGPGGPTGAPWGTTVVDRAQCGLLGGSFRDAVDPDHSQGYDCVWEPPR